MRIFIIMFVVAFGLSITLLMGFISENKTLKLQLETTQTYIQNICEIQQKLKDAGYYTDKIDGIWGSQTEKAYCDWCAAQHFKE